MSRKLQVAFTVMCVAMFMCKSANAVDLPLDYVDGMAGASSEAYCAISGGLPSGQSNDSEEQVSDVYQYATASSTAGGATALAQISVDAEDISGAYISELTNAMLQQASVSFANPVNNGYAGTYGGCTVRRTVEVANDPTTPVFVSGTLITTISYSPAFVSNLGAGSENRYTIDLRCGGSRVRIDASGDNSFLVDIHIERTTGDYDVSGTFDAAGLRALGTTFQGSEFVTVGQQIEMSNSSSGELFGIVTNGTRSGDINISSYVTAHVVDAQ